MVTETRNNTRKLVIMPAYNEQDTVVEQCREVQSKAPGYDIIVINDHSEDETLARCSQAGIRVLNHSVNLGIGGAMQSGYRYAAANGYDIAEEDADMVIGSRFIEREGYQSTTVRRWGIRYFSGLIRLLTGQRVTDPTSGYRMVRGDLIGALAREYPQDYPEPESVVRLLRQGRKVVEVPVKMRERGGGTSSITARNSVYYIIKVTMAIMLERMRK